MGWRGGGTYCDTQFQLFVHFRVSVNDMQSTLDKSRTQPLPGEQWFIKLFVNFLARTRPCDNSEMLV